MITEETESQIIFEAIQPQVDAAFDRHIERTRRDTISLDPYALVPREDFDSLYAAYQAHVAQWADAGIDIKPVARATLLVDTATEGNLPWYTAHIAAGFEAWMEWNGRWTAEERSHEEIMLRDIEARAILDMSTEWLPVREQNMAAGIHIELDTPAKALAYVTTQELLTRDAHFHSARLMDGPGARNLRQIGADEGRHAQFYGSALRALGEVAPDYALAGMRTQHEGNAFAMPGQKGIPGYNNLANVIALSGVFDAITVLEAQKRTIDDARLLEVEPVTDQGKADQEWAAGISEETDSIWERRKKLMDITRARAAEKASEEELRPFILGATVELVDNAYVPLAA